MGHHGWRGDPPPTEEAARQRIIAATLTCIERHGPDRTTLSDVAAELGVIRQTVYRYYPSLADLLAAVAQAGLADFVGRMQDHLASATSPADAAVEAIVFAVRSIPDEPYIGLLFQAGETDIFSRGVTSPEGLTLGAQILSGIPVDWSEIGVAEDELGGLAEIMMRLFVSFLQYPADPPHSEDELRTLVRRWLGPALRA